MPRNQDLNLLPIFDALMQEEKLSRAAERLSMSQPAVSKALQRLRLSYKDELFVRTRRGLKPTPRAFELHRELAPALEIIRTTYDAGPFHAERVDRVFNVSMNSTVELLSTPPLIARMNQLAPNAKVKIHPEYLPDIPARLKDGRLDYAIDFVQLPDGEFSSHLIVKETITTICAPDHPMAGKRVTPYEFQGMQHVSVMPRSSHLAAQSNQLLTPLEHLLGATLPERNIVCHSSGFIAVPDIVAASDLIAIVPKRLVNQRLKGGTLATIEVPIELPTLELFLFWHHSRNRDPAHRWFIQLLDEITAEI